MNPMQFLKDTYQSPCQYGQKKISLYITQAFLFNPDVVFEFFENNHVWTVCWSIDVTLEQFFTTVRTFQLDKAERTAIIHDPTCNQAFYEALRKISPIRSHPVDENTVELLNELCKNGLPEPKWFPDGFDGHNYRIVFDGLFEEYSCWCNLPEEWGILYEMINTCVSYANLYPDTYGATLYTEDRT